MRKVGFPIFVLALIGAVLLISCVSADLITPATSATISGNTSLNATNGTLVEMLNCTFYAKSASTINSSWTLLAVELNTSAFARSINATFDTAGLEDSNDYVLNASCSNASSIQSWTNTGITIDNTDPVAPSSLSPVNNEILTTAGSQTFSATVNNAKTTGCTYVIGRGGTAPDSADTTSGTATYSATTCSFTKTLSATDNGVWTWKMTATDGTDTSTSGADANVQIPASGGGLPATPVTNVNGQLVAQTSNNTGLIVGIVLAVIVIGGLILVIRRR